MSSKSDDSKSHCKFCNTDIRAHLKDLRDHAETKKHKMRCPPMVKALMVPVSKGIATDEAGVMVERHHSVHMLLKQK